MEDDVRYVERKVTVPGCEEDVDICASRLSEQLVAEMFDDSVTVGVCATESHVDRERACFSANPTSRKSGYGALIARIETALKRAECHQNTVAFQTSVSSSGRTGRVGGQSVVLDGTTMVGNMHMDSDRLGLVGASDFSTVRANCAVYSGKWMYEALLGTRGVMQFGWCTLECQFSEEKGVGDTTSSYAYDGNRLRKWNMTTERYGEPWFAGDVIGCAIDLDEATISFYRNGRPLGTAFNNVPIGPGVAYFPAFSLSLSEAVRLNFGALPFMHPVTGYQPLQNAPLLEEATANKLMSFLERILIQSAATSSNPLLANLAMNSLSNNSGISKRESESNPTSCATSASACAPSTSGRVSTQSTACARTLLHLSAYHVLQRLATYLTKAYHVHSCLVGMLVRFHKMCLDNTTATAGPDVTSETDVGARTGSTATTYKPELQAYIDLICHMLELFWMFLHESEVTQSLEHLLVAVLTLYRYSAVPADFSTQKRYLQIVLALLSHARSRRFLLSHVLFDRVRFPLFLHIKPPDDGVLEQLIPQTWLIFAHKQEDLSDPRFTRTDDRYAAYLRSCAALQKRLSDLQQLQTELLKLLLRDDDDELPVSSCPAVQAIERTGGSRAIFVRKLRAFMAENYPANARTAHLTASQCPIPVVLCFLHHLIRAVGFYYQRLLDQVNAATNGSPQHTAASQTGGSLCGLGSSNSPPYSPGASSATLNSASVSSPLAFSTGGSAASRSSPVRHKTSTESTSSSSRSLPLAVGPVPLATLLPPLASVYIPINKFYDPMFTQLDVQRLGGLATYLKKTYKAEIDTYEKQRGSVNTSVRSAQQLAAARSESLASVRRRTAETSPQLPLAHSSKSVAASSSTHHHKVNPARSLFSSIFPFASSPSAQQAQGSGSPTGSSASLSACASLSSYPATPTGCPVQPQSQSQSQQLHALMFSNAGGSSCSSSNLSYLPSASASAFTSANSPAYRSPSSSATHCPVSPSLAHAERDFDATHSSLLALVDSCVLLYHIGAHKQNGKMAALRENMRDYYLAYCDTEAKLARCGAADAELRTTLEHTRNVFETKLTEDSRHMAWILAVVFVEQNRAELFWLMRVLLSTVKRARQVGHLFSLLPDYYLDSLVNMYHALCNYFHPTLDIATLENFEPTLVDFGKFLVKNTNDKRIVTHDVKDKLLQSLCAFASYRYSLKALERLSLKTSDTLLQMVLQVYENRSWTQTNLILIRFWKGCGWAFRYVHLPHIMPLRSQQNELLRAAMEPASPSLVYQERIRQYLVKDYDRATTLISSVLNELNWSFSEFVCLINDIHQVMNQAEQRVLMFNRQMKLCATLFDLSVSLLRVVEMFVHLVPDYFLNSRQRPCAEMLLARLYQIIAQILNRVTSKGGTIIEVLQLNLAELESIDRFPILAAIVGVMSELVTNHDNPKWREEALRGLINEASFDLASLQYLLGFDLGATSRPTITASSNLSRGESTSLVEDYQTNSVASGYSLYADVVAAQMRTGAMHFSLRNYKEVNRREMQQLEQLVHLITVDFTNPKYQKPTCNEDQLCDICYANARNATFKPCNHQSCKSCISQQMLIKKECFFCKGSVLSVHDTITGEPMSFK